jgi:hypothetical protein
MKLLKEEFESPPIGFAIPPLEEPVEDGDGCPDVPDVDVEDPHWKVGDGMNKQDGTPDYTIGQIALVSKPPDLSGKARFDVVMFDTKGVERGRWNMIQD